MGYKILGYAVWQGAKWYLRGRIPSRKIALGVLAGALLAAGAAVAQRQRTSS